MAQKIFPFTEKELLQMSNEEEKPLALTGETWEAAMRYMDNKPFGNCHPELDEHTQQIGFLVSWLELEEQIEVIDQAPLVVFEMMNSNSFDNVFIEVFIKKSRELLLESFNQKKGLV